MSVKRGIGLVLAVSAAVVTGIVSSSVVYAGINERKASAVRESYYRISPENIDALFRISDKNTLLLDEKAYNIFETNCLGNTSAALLSYGCYCKSGDLICVSEGKTVLKERDTETVISERPSSYINILDDYVYYRDDVTRGLYRYSISKRESECLVKAPCGEVVASKKGVSYLDMATDRLMYMDFEQNRSAPISADAITSFAVIGESYYCLKDNGDFGVVKKNGTFRSVSSDVDRFYFDGKIALQKGDKIYVLNDTKASGTRMLTVEGTLIGLQGDKLFVHEKQNINAYDVETLSLRTPIASIEQDEIIKGFYPTESAYEILIYTKDAQFYDLPHFITAKEPAAL